MKAIETKLLPTCAEDFEEFLAEAIEGYADAMLERDDIAVRSFEHHGLLTRDNGVCVQFEQNGAKYEFQITIVDSSSRRW